MDPIPTPPGLPFIGNLLDVRDEVPIRALENLSNIYGPIYKLKLGGKDRIFITSQELFEEVCDETRFWKMTIGALQNKHQGAASGLFTALHEDEPDWG